MYEYSYHNIFETKGIEYIITIGFFLVLIPFWFLLNRKESVQQLVTQLKGMLQPEHIKIPKGIYLSPNHTWAFLEKEGLALIGIDNLLTGLSKNAELRLLKSSGDCIKKGEVVSEITQNGKTLHIVSPLTGKIAAFNTSLEEALGKGPDALYTQGWFFKISPENWKLEVQDYPLSDQALNWLKAEIVRFKSFIVASVQQLRDPQAEPVMLDGGELIDFPLDELPQEAWSDFEKKFLKQL